MGGSLFETLQKVGKVIDQCCQLPHCDIGISKFLAVIVASLKRSVAKLEAVRRLKKHMSC